MSSGNPSRFNRLVTEETATPTLSRELYQEDDSIMSQVSNADVVTPKVYSER